jgi:hypothetical protein
MSDMTVTDPKQLAELLEQIENMKNLFSTLAQREADRPKKGKTREDLNNLVNGDFPVLVLSKQKYTNKKGEINETSLRSQFKQMAKEMELDFEPSLVSDGTNLYLVNLDAQDAERKFNEYVLRTAGIGTSDLYAASLDLDTATK